VFSVAFARPFYYNTVTGIGQFAHPSALEAMTSDAPSLDHTTSTSMPTTTTTPSSTTMVKVEDQVNFINKLEDPS